MLIPYEVNTLIQRTPWANLGIFTLNLFCFALLFFDAFPEPAIEAMILGGWDPVGFLGYQFLHGGFMHLFSNLVALWVFGNAISGVMRQELYIPLYLGLGVAGGMLDLAIDGSPVIGASGAISGLTGFYLAVYPTNSVSCLWWFFIRGGTVQITGYWLVLFWFVADLFFAFGGAAGVAHWAHIGGALAGVGAGLLWLRLGWVDRFDYDHPTLPELLMPAKA